MKYKKYSIYHNGRYVETYNSLEKAQSHIRFQERSFNSSGWTMVETEHDYKISATGVANLISLVVNTMDKIYSGNYDAVTDMINHIKNNESLYGYPREVLVDHIFKVTNNIRCIEEYTHLKNNNII